MHTCAIAVIVFIYVCVCFCVKNRLFCIIAHKFNKFVCEKNQIG